MSPEKLSQKLKEMHACLKKEGVLLFGIVHVNELEACGSSVIDIVHDAFKDNPNINGNSYVTEVHSGQKLAKYVQLKEESCCQDH